MKKKQSRLPGKLKNLFLLLALNMVVACCFAQVNITGKVSVTSAGTTNDLTGISVTLKGTKFGTGTDNSGAYKLSATVTPGKYIVVFSGVGYQKEEVPVTISNAGDYTVDAQLTASVSSLDEVVVTGTSAGTTRRQLGSYISSVKADDLTKGATGNVLAALQGKTAGAQIT
ncbi:MAG: carboxypeptidase-like regulatory domain-containing protein, partial [Ferruginibacter sp.]